jgi:O-succinylbenzoate synthase
MHIDSIELFHLALPLKKPLPSPAGPCNELQTVLVRMQSGEAVGWGEASPGNGPWCGPDWAAGVFLCVRDWLVPRLVGTEIDSGRALQERLASVQGNRFAKAALDTAWWDLHARVQGVPLHELLGKARDAVELGASFDRMESIDEFLEAIGRAFESGVARVELKFRPGWDIPMVAAVRQSFPVQTIHIDVEGSMRLDHMEMLCRLDDFSLTMIEQPLEPDDLVGSAMIGETIRTPVGLDEGIATPHQAEMALDLHSAKYVNLKLGRVGGFTPAMEIHDACQEHGVSCFAGAMPQTGIGTRHGLALAAKANCTYPADFLPMAELLETDLTPPVVPIRDSDDNLLRVRLWSEPGIGVEPDAALLEKLSVASCRLSEPATEH